MWRLADRNPCDQSQTVVFHPFPVPMTAFVNGLDLEVSGNIVPFILISRMYPNDYRCGLLQSDMWPSRQGNVPNWLLFLAWGIRFLADQYVRYLKLFARTARSFWYGTFDINLLNCWCGPAEGCGIRVHHIRRTRKLASLKGLTPIIVRKNVSADTCVASILQTSHYDYWCGCYSPIYGRHITEMSHIGWFSRPFVRDSWPICTWDTYKCSRKPPGHFDISCEPVWPFWPP